MNDSIRVATAQYLVRPIASWTEFADQAESVVRTAADYGSQLVVLPEYFTIQLLSLGDPRKPVREQIHGLTRFLPMFLELFTGLARRYKIHIVAGSIPGPAPRKGILNESYLFTPRGKYAAQAKLHMTRFENEVWKVSPGPKLQVFDTSIGKIAIAICYDVEFPELIRAAALAGAQIVCVPSYTDNRRGWLRVRYCAQARTVENQIYVIQSSTVGGLPQIPDVHLTYGISSILTPSDYAFARDGILAEGTPNHETIVFGDLSLKALARARKEGSVLPLRDSARSPVLARTVKTVRL
jgi:predicted amidohydrolase